MPEHKLRNCPECSAEPGGIHPENCPHALCPDCGDQLLLHTCPHWAPGVDGPGRPPVWHGYDPTDKVAHTLNWMVPNYHRVQAAVRAGCITWDQKKQDWVIGHIDNDAIDRESGKFY